tara:strand:- start:230 stop:1111 length:882 start_codon:yes stop_codon:yes gene_type:complete
MPLVTKHKYYIDENLKSKFDFCITRQNKDFDHLFIVDGDEGYGKSTAVIGWANYIAEQTGKSFTSKNVFFNPDELMEFAGTTEQQVIVWDEAALGGLSIQWQNKVQQKLIQMLMVARKKKHFWFFVIPKFFRLNEYVVVDRAISLIHIYSPDDLNRGNFVYFNRGAKNRLYYEVKRNKIRNYKRYTFAGKYVQKGFVIDKEDYEKRKDQAIESIFKSEDKTSNRDNELRLAKYLLSMNQAYTREEIREYFKIGETTYYDWRNYIKKYPNLIEFREYGWRTPKVKTSMGESVGK